MSDFSELGYSPVNIGKMYRRTSTLAYGLAYDHNRTLVALSVQGPNTQVEQIHYELQGQENSTGVIVRREDEFDRYFYSKGCHFRVYKNPIPDTGEVSMIMLNEHLFRAQADQQYTYLKASSLDVFKNELYHRVKSIVFCSVLPEWADYLYSEGTSRQDSARRILCGVFANRSDGGTKWMCAGFSLGYCTVDPQPWTELISEGLSKRRIVFPESQNGSEQQEQEDVKPNTAILYRVDGSQEVVTPVNGTHFDRHELYPLLGADTVEVTPLHNGTILLSDENAQAVDEPEFNMQASLIFRRAFPGYEQDDLMIFGNAIHCNDEMFR